MTISTPNVSPVWQQALPRSRRSRASPRAQAYPSRPVTMIVPYLAGGPADGLARPLAERMSKALGQPVVIENVPGESGVTRRRARGEGGA